MIHSVYLGNTAENVEIQLNAVLLVPGRPYKPYKKPQPLALPRKRVRRRRHAP